MGERARAEFVGLFMEQRERLESYLFGRVRCRATAADLAQDAFVRIWRRDGRGLEGDLTGYLYRTARNLAIDHVRARRVLAEHAGGLAPVQLMAEEAPPDARVEARQELAALEQALRELGARTRTVFLLNKLHGKTYGEVAAALGISVSAVEKHMLRALKHCRGRLAATGHRGGRRK